MRIESVNMIPSNTICVSQEGPANALALNKDCTQVVIAGRNVYKVFSIGENEFSEVCNLRVGKNLNLNFSSIDVAWSTIEENTLATAATNGAVVVWNLGKSGRSKQEHVFSDHKRTVNKVSFHLTEPALLISGSQDGMMKCFDLRMKEVARTFISNTESIRDVQFSPHQANTFAAVSENGSVQLWDVRRHERCIQQFTAHSGPVFACDWHPEMPWLATASRDKTIKVWDIHAKPNLEHTIYTIASVGHVKWRPQKKFQVASCALVLDCAVHVWDVRRPHVPLATFAEHRDVTTAIAWQAEPHAFLSTSRDCSLYRHRFTEAAHPVLWANPHGVCLSARGELAHAQPAVPLPALPPAPHPPPDRHLPGLGRKQPTAGSLSAAAQAILERAFPGGASSTLTRYRRIAPADPKDASNPTTPLCPVVACALEYKIRGAPPHELAEHNAKVARKYNRHMVGHVWDVVRCAYSLRTAPAPAPAHPAAHHPAHPAHPPRPDPPPRTPPYSFTSSTVEEEPLEEVEEWADSFHNSGVLGMPTLSIYIPPAKYSKRTADEVQTPTTAGNINGWVSAASAHYVDVDAADWTLPEEAFPLRAAPAPGPGPALAPAPAPAPGPAHTPAARPLSPALHQADKEIGRVSGSTGGGSPGGGSSPSSGLSAPPLDPALVSQISRETEEGEAGAGSLCLAAGAAAARFEPAPHIARALRHHAALGDSQTACTVLLALTRHRSDLFPYIDEGTQEHWLLGYIEFLQRHKLFNQATEVVRCAWVSSVWAISQQSTCVSVCCARCGRRGRPPAPPAPAAPAPPRAPCLCAPAAPRPAPPDVCALCHQVVRGLYAWCQGCAHGGHLHHMRAWMSQHRLCPAGCGHRCQLG